MADNTQNLGTATATTTINDEGVLLTTSKGAVYQIKKADLAEVLRGLMSVATSSKNGLMSATIFTLLSKMTIATAGSDGANILGNGVNCFGLCIGADGNGNHCLYSFVKTSGVSATRTKISGTLELGATNALGTSLVTGATSHTAVRFSF